MKTVGIDAGFLVTKAVADNAATHFPSYTHPWRELPVTLGQESIEVACDSGRYFIGEMAVRQARVSNPWFGRGRDSLPLYYAALTEVLRERLNWEISLVAGLPVNWWDDRKALKESLEGDHVVERIDRSCSYMYRIAKARVIPQPFGTLFALALSPAGKAIRSELLEGRVLILDIGGYTTDCLLVDSLSPVMERSGGIEIALQEALQTLIATVEKDYGVGFLSVYDSSLVRGSIHVDGVPTPVPLAPAMEPLAEEIKRFVFTRVGNLKDVDHLLISGGGGEVLFPFLGYKRAEKVPSPMYANATGFYRYGLFSET